jgi:hypothetical protein
MNTIGTGTYGSSYRAKYFSSNLQSVLRKATVAEAVCNVDRSDDKYIHNPYSNQPTAAIQAVAGTYSVSAWTITDDSLTKTDEAIYGEHVFDFEEKMNHYNIMATRMDEMAYAVAYGIDYFVVNNLCEDGTGTYSTPSGGFTTAANWPVILANLVSKVSGYADSMRGMFLIVENSDLVGVLQSQMATGFNFADMALRNGLVSTQLGVDIYVVRDSTFVSTTIGSTTVTNSGHRVFGVKGSASYSLGTPVYEEKGVSGKTGKEIAYGTHFGFKLWAQKASLIVDITVTA